MMKHFSLLITFFFASLSIAMAQTTVTGVVSDDTGEPLIGVTVLIEGTTTGVVTDIDGTFEIAASSTDVLIFSYTGMDEKRVTVGNQTQMAITLTTANQLLNEVVVTGYGNQLRSTYTGAASTAPIERIAQVPRATFAESLSGNVAGVVVNQGSGQPGAFQNVRIRGLGSINAGSNPLYVIDGIPVINDNIGNESTTSTPLSGLNPQDIADIQVLKDASATSIYGSRAANGVIIITTKRGTDGKPKINFNLQSGINDVSLSDRLQPLNTEEYLEVMREAIINAGRATEANVDQFFADNNIDVNQNTNWFDEITQQGQFTTANFSMQGGNERTNYFFSAGYNTTEGTVISTDFERLSTRMNLSTQATDWLQINVNVSASHTNQNTVPGGGAFANPVRSIYRFVPTQPVRNPDGSFNLGINSGFNVVGQAELNTDIARITTLIGGVNAVVKLPVKGLTYEPYVSIQSVQGRDETFFVPDFGTGASRNGFGEADFDNRENWLVRNMLKYTNLFNDAHGIDITLGQEAQKFNQSFVQTLQGNFAIPGLITLSNGSVPETIGGTKTENSITSYFLNTSYNYKGLFYINGTVRRDGSSRFGADTRYGNFWSVGGAVNLHRFDFLADNPTISSLRIRSSYGVNGNEAIGNFASRGLYGTGADYLNNPGILLNQLENANLTWEVNKPFNVGVEVGLWNRIDIIADFYTRTTSELLFNRPVSRTNGVASVLSNIGELENRGVELSINTQNFVSQNNGFEWNTSFNITFNTNEVKALPEGDFADGSRFRAVGQPWSTWFMRGYAGVDVQTGAPLWYTDETETETTTSYNGAELYDGHGNSEPLWTGGLTNTFRYKGFDLTVLVTGDWGRTLLHSWHSFTHTDGSRGFSTTGNMARSIYERRWQQPGDVTDTPQVLFAQNRRSRDRSSRFLYDGSHLNLRDVVVGYTLPQSLTQRWGLSNVRLTAQGSNLAVYIKDDRLERDPRTDAGGAIDQELPIPRTFTFGLDVSF